MNDFRMTDCFHAGRAGVLLAMVTACIVLLAWPLMHLAAHDKGDTSAHVEGFEYHCEERVCQFWLTDASLMLRSGLQYEWDFGDGQVSDAPAPVHVYERGGRFEPELKVFDHRDEQLLVETMTILLGFDPEHGVDEIGAVFFGQEGDFAGWSMAGLGDFNSSGPGDLLIGAPELTSGAGRAYFVFGDQIEAGSAFELDDLEGDDGFVFTGTLADPNGFSGMRSVGASTALLGAIGPGISRAAAIGAPGDSFNSAFGGLEYSGEGSVAVVYGSSDGFPDQLSDFDLAAGDGSDGFIIRGIADEAFGFSVASAGNFIGNGLDAFVIGAPRGPISIPDLGSQPLSRGNVYILFGDEDGFPPILELQDLSIDDGFVLQGENNDDRAGWSVDGIGDFNNNEFDDIIIGAPFVEGPSNDSGSSVSDDSVTEGSARIPQPVDDRGGAAYVVFGGSNLGQEGLGTLNDDLLNGEDGFAIRTDADDLLGYSVAGVGDLNNSGSVDLAVSAPSAPYSEPFVGVSGAVYVLFGGQGGFGAEFDPSTGLDGSNGFAVTGLFQGQDGDFDGDRTVAIGSAGDINGNGFDDLVIGLPGVFDEMVGGAGFAYVIFGRDGDFPAEIDLTELDPDDGFVIGPETGVFGLGRSVAGLGDFNDNGIDDLALGAPPGGSSPGSAWVIAGQQASVPPLINGSDGIADQQAAFTSLFEIEFEVSDLVDAPESLMVEAFSEDTEFLPQESLTLGGEGANRTLTIDTNQASPGSVPIIVEVTNSAELTTQAVFILQILEQPPLINEGDGIPEQFVFAGQPLEVEFTVSDLQDAPGAIEVAATSQTPALIPPDGVSVMGTGANRTLRVETVLGEGGVGLVNLEATNSFGLTTVEEVVFNIDPTPAPIINDGAGIEDQEMTAGETLTIDFTVDDPEFEPDAVEVIASSGNPSVLPSGQLSIQGEGTTRTLVIETVAANVGATEITLEARNPLDGMDSVEFNLTINAAPPAINDGQPIDDAEIRAGDPLTVDFVVDDPLDPEESLEITIESSNPELIPVEAITIVGTGNERSLVIETQPGTQGESVITVTVTNTNGQQEVREFLVEIFLVPTELDLAAEAFVLPGFPDLLVRLSAANIGDEPAFGILMAADIPEPFEAIGVFIEAQGCLVENGVVSCDDELLPAWECSLFEGTLVCQLESLQAEHEAGVVLRVQGDGEAEMIALLEALNAPQIETELELDF